MEEEIDLYFINPVKMFEKNYNTFFSYFTTKYKEVLRQY